MSLTTARLREIRDSAGHASNAERHDLFALRERERQDANGAEPIRALKRRAEQAEAALAEERATTGQQWQERAACAEARVQQLDAAAFTQLKKAREEIASMPTREEWLGGQRTKYVQVDEVLAYIDAALRGAS